MAVGVGGIAHAAQGRPTTCSQSSCVPKARTPRTWVTVLASQPSVSIETLTTHLTCSPSLPALPTVFITSRSRSSSVRSLGIAAGEAGAVFGLELVDFAGGDLLEIVAHGLAGFELLAVHQDGVRAVQPGAVAVVVAEDGQLPGLDDRLVADRLFPAGDVVEDQFGDVGVVADDDEHRRRQTATAAGLGVLLPQAVVLLVVAVEAVQRPLQFDGELRFATRRRRSCGPSSAGPRGCAATGRGRSAGRRSSSRRPPARGAP